MTVQFSLFMHPDQAQNTSSGIQGQEATAVAVIYVTAPTYDIQFWRIFVELITYRKLTLCVQQFAGGPLDLEGLSLHSLSENLALLVGPTRRVTAGAQFPGRRKVPTMSQVLSSMQQICFRKRQAYFLSRVPSNFVTPLRPTQRHFAACNVL